MSQMDNNRPFSSFSSPISPMPPQRENRRRRFWRRARRGAGWCLAAGLVTLILANLTTSWLLNRELNSLRERGEPLRLTELVPPKIPDSENAALVYLRAADALKLTRQEEDLLRPSNEAYPDPALLAKNQAAIELTRQASGMHACRFPVEYDSANLAGILLPHLGKVRHLADVIRAQARLEARSGDREAALNDVAVLFRMSEHVAPEPLLISGLVAIAIEGVGYRTLALVLQDVPLTPQQAREFQGRLPHTDWNAAIRRDLQGERCFGMWAFQYVSNPIEASQLANGSNSPNPFTRILGVLWTPLWKLDEIQYLHAHDRQSQALSNPETPIVSDDQIVRDLPWYAICTKIMLPTFSHLGQKRDEIKVYSQMAQIALALNAYRTTRGHYPSSLGEAEAEWGTQFPSDFFSGKAFVYRTEGEKILLYSVGPNGKDDGGKRKSSPPGSNSHLVGGNGVDDLAW